MNERISDLLAALNIKKVQFANDIGVSAAFITEICSGRKTPSDRTINDICRIYNVNKEWLTNGTGTMFIPQSRDEEIAAFIGNTLSTDDDNFKKRLISVLAKLSVDEWVLLEKVFRKTIEETKNNPDD